MSSTRLELLTDWRAVLARVRAEAPDWSSIAFARGVDDEGLAFDERWLVRAKCLWALQYDRTEDDAPLIRAAFGAETEWHQVAPFQGLTSELSLAAFLTAKQPPPDAVAQMWRAKKSNFDTWLGFDSRFLGVGGMSAAIQYATDRDPIDADLVDHLLDGETPRFTDDDVAELLRDMAHQFPATPEDEPPFGWFDRARRSGDDIRAKVLLDEWCDSGSPPPDASLQHFLGSIGQYWDAVEVQRRVVRGSGGARRVPLDAIRLAELERLAGLRDDALRTLRSVRKVGLSDDRNGFLRRRLVEEAFHLSIGTTGRLARKAFAFADDLAKSRGVAPQIVKIAGAEPTDEWLPLVVLEAACTAATKCGDSTAASVYQRRADTERRRIRPATGDN